MPRLIDSGKRAANGSSPDSDLLIQGASVKAGTNVNLKADDDITLQATKNTSDQRSTNSNSSGSLGVNFGTDGFLVTASAGGRGKAEGCDTAWNNSHVEASNKLTMESGGDTHLKGAVVAANQIAAKVGGKPNK
jgi:filamentous hemagglutinin